MARERFGAKRPTLPQLNRLMLQRVLRVAFAGELMLALVFWLMRIR